MFWTQIEDSSINDVLIKEDVSLEEVLDHESLLQECRSQNEKLINFFTERLNFCKLLKYVLITPDEGFDENSRFKYPSLSCEVLTSDIPTLNTMLIKGFQTNQSDNHDDFSGIERPYFDQLYDILSCHTVMNPLTMSFCIKILLNILKFDSEMVMKLISEKTNCIDVFLAHIDSNAIVHFFTEFVQCDDDVVEPRRQWLIENKLVLKLAKLLGVTEYRNNSIQVLFSNILWYMSLGLTNKIISTELSSQLNEKEFLDILFVHISSLDSDSSLVSTCLKVLKNIVEMENKIKEGQLTVCVELIQNYFHSFVNLLNHPPKQMYDPMPTTVGVFRPFGPTRIEIVNLVESLLKFHEPEINIVIIKSGIFDVLLTLVYEYQWNSQFHLSLLQVLHTIFSDVSIGNTNYELQKYLIQEFHIYHWFFKLHDNLESLRPRPGYSGIVWKIGNLLDSLKNSAISDDLLSGETDIADKWPNITSNYLMPKNAYSENGPLKIDSGMKELDLDLDIVEIDDAEIEAPGHNTDSISDFFRGKSDNLDDIFGESLIDNNEDEWIVNELEMPCAPVDDDFASNVKGAIDSDDSSSSDEESPAVIRQNPKGNAAKYILSDFHNSSNAELNDLPDIPESTDVEFSSLEFNDPWELKSSGGLVQDNWAQF